MCEQDLRHPPCNSAYKLCIANSFGGDIDFFHSAKKVFDTDLNMFHNVVLQIGKTIIRQYGKKR